MFSISTSFYQKYEVNCPMHVAASIISHVNFICSQNKNSAKFSFSVSSENKIFRQIGLVLVP